MRNILKLSFITALIYLCNAEIQAQTWSMKKAAIMTSYAATIDTANVLGEYPRPQMVRTNWMNLNGIWQFQSTTSLDEAVPEKGAKLSSKILVPFPVESAISGIMTHYDKMWYRRTFNVPSEWAGQRVLIHFGAVDYQSEVFINGTSMGIHKGGYDPFTYDITSSLVSNGSQEITVRVFDPTQDGGQPRGKQCIDGTGIMYTPSSGIWQSVWLEPVPTSSIASIKMIPNIDNSTLKFNAISDGPTTGLKVHIEVSDGGNIVSTFEGSTNADLYVPVPNPKLWSPDSPFLYDLKVTLMDGITAIDSLTSYFGMRKISVGQVGNYKKMYLNNEFLFQLGPLEQGFWPDGLYTAPTDLAIQNDLRKTKQFGFNMIRKHIKVEPYRYYYWADKMGLLIWQDMPSANSYLDVHPAIDTVEYKSELLTMVKTHWNSPSIVTWVVFNESQGQHDTQALCSAVRSLDPSRLVNQASGGSYYNVGQILDVHSYPAPACPTSSTQILACGEYGGIGYTVSNHIWRAGTTYVMVDNPAELFDMYNSFADQLLQFKSEKGLSAAVYTELTDVEAELNGLMTYDRALVKGSISKYFTVNQRVINNMMYLTDVLPTALVTAKSWKYTTDQPATDWYTSTFDASSWETGNGGFGNEGITNGNTRTIWGSSDIWLRQTFDVGSLTSIQVDSLVLKVFHDEDCEIYINGVLASTLTGYNTSYMEYQIDDLAKEALILNGSNTMAIHCKQTEGGQYIDAGISLLSYEKQQILSTKVSTVQNKSKIYPNPVTDKLSVIRKNAQTKLIGIYNLIGNEVMRLNKSESQVNVSSLSSGIYFIKTNTEGETETLSFIKK